MVKVPIRQDFLETPVDDLADPHAASVSVLLVDDSADTREMYELVLSLEGFRVTHAEDGAAALDRLFAALPDVVVADVSIPNIDGIELLGRIRHDPRTAAIPVIVMSGWADPIVRRRATVAGATSFLLKPFSPDALVAEIQRTVATRRPRQAES